MGHCWNEDICLSRNCATNLNCFTKMLRGESETRGEEMVGSIHFMTTFGAHSFRSLVLSSFLPLHFGFVRVVIHAKAKNDSCTSI